MRSIVFLLLSLFNLNPLMSQVGIGTTTPVSSSILDITSSNKGILIPRVSLNDVNNNLLDGVNISEDGLFIFNTNAGTIGGQGVGFYYYTGLRWERMALTSEMDDDWVDVGVDIKRSSGDVYIGNTSGTNNNLYISNQIVDWDNSNYILDPSGNNKVNEIEFDDGSAADPSIRFDDATTGFFSPQTDAIAFSINSAEKVRIHSNGNLGIGTSNPSSRIDVAGTFTLGVHGNAHSGMYSLPWDFGVSTFPGNTSVILTFSGTSSMLNIPQSSNVSVSFVTDLGPDLMVQSIWTEADSVNLRIYNQSGSPITKTILVNLLFLWQ